MHPISRYIDAAILKPESTQSEVIDAIQACLALNVFSVCVRPCDIALAQAQCKESDTAVCVVLGFPHGVQLAISKADEAAHYIAMGVDEIDMVANYGFIKSGEWDKVKADIAGVAKQTKTADVVLKVIFETAHLSSEEIKQTVEICIQAGADYVKTSTGFNGEGAKDEDVKLMLSTAAGRIKVKPSGGIRDAARARFLLDWGVHRLGIGWSACEAICAGEAADGGGY